MTLVKRQIKGSALTHAELDANWDHVMNAANLTGLPEIVQDIIGAAAASGIGVTVTYNDTAGTLTIALSTGAQASLALADSAVQPGSLGTLAGLNNVATGNLDDNAVTLGKFQSVATATILGRSTAGTGPVEPMTPAVAVALLPVATTTLKGLIGPFTGTADQCVQGDGTIGSKLPGATDIGTNAAPVVADSLIVKKLSDGTHGYSTGTQIIAGLGLATKAVGINAQTGTAYTLAATDGGAEVTMSNAAANTLTIPANATVALPVGFICSVTMLGAGVTTVDGATGVTVNGVSGGGAAISAQYRSVTLKKIATDTWVMQGAHGAVA